MHGECYFCNGIVTANEEDDFLLNSHADHGVFLHRRCAAGHELLEERDGPAGSTVEISCPECGAIETR